MGCSWHTSGDRGRGLYVLFSGIGSSIEASCSVDRLGEGKCQFTNTGWTAGTVCPNVSVVSRIYGTHASTKICSGIVWPNDTVQRTISVLVPPNHCGGIIDDWNGICDLVITEDAITESPEAPSSIQEKSTALNRAEHLPEKNSSVTGRSAESSVTSVQFEPLLANGQISIGRCNMGVCSWAKWISIRSLPAGRDEVNLEATLLG